MNTQPANFPKILLPFVIAIGLCAIGPSLAIAQLANINPIKDNTLYEYDPAEGDLSNALGNHFFAGETGTGELRRGVLAFDIAGNIPAGSTILGVTLSLNMSRTASATPRTIELEKKATERRPRPTMPHGGTVSSIPFFGRPKAETFPAR